MSDIKKLTKAWAKKIGYQQAVSRLIAKGISARAAERLCGGDYTSQPKSLMCAALLDEMSKDGFALANEAS